MVYPIQVGRSFIVSYGHVSPTWTEGKTVDLSKVERSWEVLIDGLSLEMDNLDSGLLGYAGHGQHLSAGVEPNVVNLCGEVEYGFLWLGLG